METKIFYDYIATSMLLADEALLEIEQITEKYPWFTLAQQLILENYHHSGDSRYAAYSTRVALSAPSREHLYNRLYQSQLATIYTPAETLPQDESLLDVVDEEELTPTTSIKHARAQKEEALLDVLDEKEEGPVAPVATVHTQKIVVTGSDYFASDVFTVDTTYDDPIARFIVEKPKINPYTSPLLGISLEEMDVKIHSSEELDIVTETLAKIYEEQGFYNLAVDTYKKLILLDRKKSAFFADRIKEMKSKHKH